MPPQAMGEKIMSDGITIMLVDDHSIVHQGVRAPRAASLREGIQVTGFASSPQKVDFIDRH